MSQFFIKPINKNFNKRQRTHLKQRLQQKHQAITNNINKKNYLHTAPQINAQEFNIPQ